MEQFYEYTDNSVVVTAVAYNNIEWASTPDYVQCELSKGTLETAQLVADFLKKVQYTQAQSWYSVPWELLSIDEDAEYEEKENTLPPLVEFESSELRISGNALKVYSDSDLQIILHLKHSDEEIWAELGNAEELLQKLEEHITKDD